jgi:3-methyladenine DNA glycosylase AlkD
MNKKLSPRAASVYAQITPATKLGDLRNMAKDIKTDHALAMELWSTAEYLPRQLAILLMDKKQLAQEVIDQLDHDMQSHDEHEQNQLIDWLMANQLSKHKTTVALMERWEHSPSVLQRRTFWYYQGRLRWMGNTPPPNTGHLLASIEERMENETPQVQWAMNFTAAQIGIHEPGHRSRCVDIGKRIGLYKDEVVAKGCTPRYLPEYIKVEVTKRKR